MSDEREKTLDDLLKQVPTSSLINALQSRSLTNEDISTLHSLKPTEEPRPAVTTPSKDNIYGIIQSAERYAASVVRKYVHGKLPKDTLVAGHQVENSVEGGFHNHGPNNFENPDIVHSLQSNIYHGQRQYPDLMNSTIVSLQPSTTSKENMVCSLYFFQDRKAPDSRGYYTPAHVQAELPREVATQFVSEIQTTPDLLEMFYQKMFPGLDGTDKRPGMRRAKSDSFYLIENSGNMTATRMREDSPRAILSNVPKFNYRNGPYGSGEPYSPR